MQEFKHQKDDMHHKSITKITALKITFKEKKTNNVKSSLNIWLYSFENKYQIF